jgi:hypothetical protein
LTYIEDLGRELTRHGIRGTRRCRILGEVIDHLSEDPSAEERFGTPRDIANAFAAELGAQASRRAAVTGFAALGVAGVVYGVAFVSLAIAGPPSETLAPTLGAIALATLVIAPQISLVAGVLALVRARRRGERMLPTKELAIIRRRTSVALASGLVTMGALALYAWEFRAQIAGWWTTFAYVSAATASVLICAALVPVVSAARLKPQIAGDAGDVFDDLGFRAEPWRFAAAVACSVGLAVWLAGAVQGDPIDGLIRGVFEGLACFAGFAALGRYLGLRR